MFVENVLHKSHVVGLLLVGESTVSRSFCNGDLRHGCSDWVLHHVNRLPGLLVTSRLPVACVGLVVGVRVSRLPVACVGLVVVVLSWTVSVLTPVSGLLIKITGISVPPGLIVIVGTPVEVISLVTPVVGTVVVVSSVVVPPLLIVVALLERLLVLPDACF